MLVFANDESETREISLPGGCEGDCPCQGDSSEFCTHHKTEAMDEIETPLKSFDMSREVVQECPADFVYVEIFILIELTRAANTNYMNVNSLKSLTCAAVASILVIKGNTSEEIRTIFNISNDLSPPPEKEYISGSSSLAFNCEKVVEP